MGTPDPASRSTDAPLSLIDRLTSPRGMVIWVVLAAMVMPVTSSIYDPDFWWHLRAGQILLDTHHLIGTDPFTYTATSHTWTMHEWLTEVGFALLHRVGGLGLIVLVFALVTWLGMFAVYARARLDRPDVYVLGGGTLLGTLVGYPIWGPRTQMITFALAALTLLWSERFLRDGGRRIWWLVPIFTVWSNFHSGFLIGIAFLVVIGVADLIGHRVGWPGSAPPNRARTLLYVAAACTVAAMINPNGPAIVLYPLGTVGSQAQETIIQEWHSPDFHLWEVAFLYAPMVFTLGLAIILNRSIRARETALVLATIILSLQSVRNIALFVAAATPVWITQVNAVLQRWQARQRRPRRPPPLPPLGTRLAVSVVVALVLIASLAIRVGGAVAVREDSIATEVDNNQPVCAVRWLLTAPPGLRIFNQYGEGGYLSYKLSAYGDRVFIFGDAALMGDSLLLQYAHIGNLQWDWQKILDQYHTDIVLFDVNAPITDVLDQISAEHGRWTMVYKDNRTEAFIKTADAARLNLPAAPPVPSDPHDTCNQLSTMPLPQKTP